jgi:predicted DNA-binding protein
MAQRTQIYLTDDQRARLDEVADRQQLTMAEVVRRAIDAYLELGDDLDAAFGAARGLGATVPGRDEWDRG